jgi:hypothetical protein
MNGEVVGDTIAQPKGGEREQGEYEGDQPVRLCGRREWPKPGKEQAPLN